jgi:Dolichyl-phosphate-mannose-protein mannosyltransferase
MRLRGLTLFASEESMAQTLNKETADAYLVIEPRRALANARRWAIAHTAELICAALLAVMSLQMLVIISRKSITIDEIVFIPSAYYHLAEGNFQFVYEHPPLSKFLAGVPLLLIQPNEPVLEKGVVLTPDQRWAAMSALWEKNPDKFAAMMFWTRVPIIALTIVLGILIFVFARRLFGPGAATLAVALFSLEPTVLAHGRVVQTDIPATFGYLLFFIALYHYYEKRTLRSALWVGAVMGLAFLAKFSMLMLGPLFVVFFIALHARKNNSRPELTRLLIQLGLTVLVTIVLINIAYPASHRPIVDIDVSWIQEKFPLHSQAVIQSARAVSYFLPTEFVLGTVQQLAHNGEGHPASMLGMYRRLGWWYYFPVAFALKTTVPFLLVSIASVIWAVSEWIRKRESRFLWTVGPFAIYTIYLLFSHIDIGVRHYLPAYPFLFILGGALLDRMIKSPHARRAGMIAALTLLGWICVEAWRAFPNHIPYMNQFASSSHPHWWYLSDSNVEWGDDARELALYLQARGETRVRSAFLGDFLTLGRYGIESITLIPRDGSEPQAAHYSAIGASFLNGSVVPDLLMTQGHWVSDSERVNFFEAYRQRVPEAVFGGSIYLYREDGN